MKIALLIEKLNYIAGWVFSAKIVWHIFLRSFPNSFKSGMVKIAHRKKCFCLVRQLWLFLFITNKYGKMSIYDVHIEVILTAKTFRVCSFAIQTLAPDFL
jgi:hypothetical protein